ncbi:carbohydrate ABC transporter permease [Phaeobacter inhibens]|jgi:multiple sugar transport system permease protein|uniref:carbohydrate ABC transporter permease n=1 Tax=Phaeobacter inhibens TaxID=221822 RepID=UPI0001632F8F|nr:carbohydrate ABC transporter permease [Phaeobacter inhibens]AFO92733.1 putative ABC transporter permease protein [Phaeobacter inhibens DSM 17395]AUQ47437.1 putative ABC transporter permease protein [Phaeobacter inhibens]AXT24040.1 carbohydrate ABC transporter permease [Phaeobacter inhibens]
MTRDWWKHLILILGVIVVIAPFYMMVSYSFKSPGEIDRGEGGFFGRQEMMVDERCVKLRDPNRKDVAAAAHRFPGASDGEIRDALVAEAKADCAMRPVVFNYSKAFTEAPLLRYLLNGIIVTGSIFLIQVVVALPAAYALAKLKFWGREAVFGLVLFCLLIPVHAIALPLYIMLAKLGLTNTYAALVVPWTISVFGIFLMRQFFMTVPDDLIDAARMDGMGEFSIVWRVMLPTAIPALLAFAIFSIVAHWNDYFWPRIVVTGNRDLFTPPLGLREFKGDGDGSYFGPMMATATVIVTPLIVAFLLAQKRFIEGITLSGMK